MVYRGLTIVFALLLYFEQCGYCSGEECQAGECANSTLDGNGKLLVEPQKECHVNGSTVTLRCMYGTLEGSSSNQCIDGAWANGTATCAFCSPPVISNLTLEPHKTIYEVEEEVNFSCDAGYKLTDDSPKTAQCILNETGTWNSTEGLECIAFNCSAPSSGDENLNWTEKDQDTDTYNGNAIITYSCSEGYKIDGSSTNECIDQDKWKFNDPECNSGRINEAVWYFLLMTTFYSLISYYM